MRERQTPFMGADVIRLTILVAFPVISLWLPRMMRFPSQRRRPGASPRVSPD